MQCVFLLVKIFSIFIQFPQNFSPAVIELAELGKIFSLHYSALLFSVQL